ncbi:MAG TPA: DUF3823 domain-containing protein [Agriterribacter sp.]|nr:DUF3823 domain-containing protein [Agriterribacter sp.]HRQ51090.1 DUF3823 domain-containing protein [Agriterribacter sp.]
MKITFHHIIILVTVAAFMSCKKDNYDPPKTKLSGKLVYQGEAIQVEYDRVPFQLYQYGFGKTGAIGGTFAPDGSYSMLLFDGDYKFVIPNDQGPFVWKKMPSGEPDSLSITLKGNQELDIEVTPYYMLRNAQLTAGGGKVSASFAAEQIITGADAKDIERVSLYINKTQFVSGANNIAFTDVAGSSITDIGNIVLETGIPGIAPAQNYVFARVGLKIAGVEDMIFTPVQKLNF